MIVVRGVKKVLPDAPALNEVNFELADGEILTIFGPSGSGKTTLLRLVAGLELPDDGEVWLGGKLASKPGWGLPPHLRGIGMAFQTPALFPHMTVAQNILFGMTKALATEQRQRLAELLTLLELTGLEKRFPHQLSGGEARRVGLARALAPKPPFLLFDEPLVNLDAALKEKLLEVIQAAFRHTVNLIYVTHDVEEADFFKGKILRLSKNNQSRSAFTEGKA